MKKSIYILASIYILLLSSPLFAQPEDPGVDPVAPAPIDDYVWVMAIIGLVFVFIKIRTVINDKKTNI